MKRIAWLDRVRLAAILLMIIDHLLLFLGEGALVRITLTRAAEPLFVFVMAEICLRKGSGIRWGRWIQLVTVGIGTSCLLTKKLGYPLADILISLALVGPFLGVMARANQTLLLILMYWSAGLGMIPITVGGLAWDYSPFLVFYQMLLVWLFHYRHARAWLHATASTLVATTAAYLFGQPVTLLIVLMGHPLALGIGMVMRHLPFPSCFLSWARWPLTTYAVHLVILSTAHLAQNKL